MTWLKKYFFRILSLFGVYPEIYSTYKINDTLPTVLKNNAIYIVEDDGYQEQVAMLCPCGCKRTLHMNLLLDERPCWKLTEHSNGTVSLHPSVWRKKDCRSHFWVKEGRVQWVKNL